MNPSFERHKLTRFIKTHGRAYTFTSHGKNEFDEPSDETTSVEVSGVFHETHEYISQSSSDAGTVVSKLSSWVMCLLEDTENLQKGMVVTIGGKDYKLVGFRDVQNFGVACDLSLELILK